MADVNNYEAGMTIDDVNALLFRLRDLEAQVAALSASQSDTWAALEEHKRQWEAQKNAPGTSPKMTGKGTTKGINLKW